MPTADALPPSAGTSTWEIRNREKSLDISFDSIDDALQVLVDHVAADPP